MVLGGRNNTSNQHQMSLCYSSNIYPRHSGGPNSLRGRVPDYRGGAIYTAKQTNHANRQRKLAYWLEHPACLRIGPRNLHRILICADICFPSLETLHCNWFDVWNLLLLGPVHYYRLSAIQLSYLMSHDRHNEAGCICMRLNPGEGRSLVVNILRKYTYKFSSRFNPSPTLLWAREVNIVSWGLGMSSTLILKQYRFPISVPCIIMASAREHSLGI